MYRRGYYKKRSKAKKLLRFAAKAMSIFSAAIVLIFTLLLVCSLFAKEETAAPGKRVVAKARKEIDAKSEIGGVYYGLCQRNSVHSIQDFRTTVESDPVLSKHFAGFDWASARLGTLEEPIWTYVSYRTGDIIGRSSKKLQLPKGDGYITDGNRMVRTYCCNDYDIAKGSMEIIGEAVVAPKDDRKEDDPPQLLLEENPSEKSPEPALEMLEPHRAKAEVGYSHPFYPPSVTLHRRSLQGHYSSASGDRPIVTPEPGTLALMAVGGAAMAAVQILKRRRNKGERCTRGR